MTRPWSGRNTVPIWFCLHERTVFQPKLTRDGQPPSVSPSIVQCDRAVAERLRRDQVEASRARQSALVQGGTVAGNPGVDKELVLVAQIQLVQRCCKFAA